MTHKNKALLIAVVTVALMLVAALTLYEWNGVFVVEGILAGLGIPWGRANGTRNNKT